MPFASAFRALVTVSHWQYSAFSTAMDNLQLILSALPVRGIVFATIVGLLGVLLVPFGLPGWRRLGIDVACGAASDWWDVLQGVCVVLDLVEIVTVAIVLAIGPRQPFHCAADAISVGLSFKPILISLLLLWAVGHPPRDSDMNTRYCAWRAVSACWKTPNTTLETYELLFPVTQATLFRREFSQPFRPLETRYEMSVLWNAMDHCRDLSTQTHTQATVFESLPASANVDAWCGAMQSSRRHHEELLVSYDAVTSPSEAFGAVVETRCRAIGLDILTRVLSRLAVVLLVSFVGVKWQQWTPRPLAYRGMEDSDSDGSDEHDDGNASVHAEPSPPLVERSWVQVNAQAP